MIARNKRNDEDDKVNNDAVQGISVTESEEEYLKKKAKQML